MARIAAMMDAIKRDELPSFYFMQYEISGRDAALRRPALADDPRRTSQRDVPTNGINWTVRNLLLIPSFAFPLSAIIKRKPLSSAARRAGWVGCNFALNRIPADARIEVVRTIPSRGGARSPSGPRRGAETAPYQQTIIVPPEEVRKQFRHIKPLKDIPVQMRGWTLDVLNVVRRISEVGTGRCAVRTSQRDVPTSTFTTADAYTFTRELEKLHPDNRHVRDKIRQQLQVLRDAGLLIHIDRGLWRLP